MPNTPLSSLGDIELALVLFGYISAMYLAAILLGRELWTGATQWRTRGRRRRAPGQRMSH